MISNVFDKPAQALTFFQICGKRDVRYSVVQIHADIRPIICSIVGPGSGCSEEGSRAAWVESNTIGSPASCAERMGSNIRVSSVDSTVSGIGISARARTFPVLSKALVEDGNLPVAEVPTPNNAHTPKNTIVAPLRLARELRL